MSPVALARIGTIAVLGKAVCILLSWLKLPLHFKFIVTWRMMEVVGL